MQIPLLSTAWLLLALLAAPGAADTPTGPVSAADLDITVDMARPAAASRWHFARGQWEVEGEALVQGDAKAVGTLARLKDVNCADFDLRLAFRPTSGGGVRAAQVAFRVQGDETYYYVHFEPRAQRAKLALHLPEQPYNVIASATKVPVRLDEWNQARIVCEGPAIRVFLNDTLLIERLDATFLGGGFGVGTSQGRVLFKDVAIRGRALPPDAMQGYKPVPFSVVCADAGAGGDEEFPDVARLSNGELICVFYAGYAHGSKPSKSLPKGGRLAYVKSRDNGRSWSAAQILFDSPDDDRDPSVCEVAPGRLLCNFFKYHYPDTAKDVLATAETFVVESTDFGESWSAEPVAVTSPFDGACATSDPIRKLPDGSLLMPVYGYRKAKPLLYVPAVVRSRDHGRTWGDATVIVEGYPTILPEPALCLLPDGRLVCHIRPDMIQCYSSDAGRTWTKPQRLPFIGDAPYLFRTSRGILLSAFRHPGTSIAWSLDEGKTWCGPQRLDISSGAYPSLVEMPDGRVLMVYYTGGVRSDIRALWLEVDRDGVRTLPANREAMSAAPSGDVSGVTPRGR